MCMNSVLSPSVGGVGLAEYICTDPYLIFTEKDPEFIPEDVEYGSVLHPTLPVVRVTRMKFRMAQDSDDLDMVHVLVWILVLVLAIVALHCPLPCRVIR